MKNEKAAVVEVTGQNYNEIIFKDDYIPKDVYLHQIRLRNDRIDRLLAGKKFKYVVDVGSGTGFHLQALGQHAETLIATDFSMGALRESKKCFNCQLIACDINRLPFKQNTIDLIWIAGVLHHVPKDLDNAIGHNLSMTLKNGGLILIDEPNRLNPLNYINMWLSKADPTGDERPLSLGKVERILKKNSIDIVLSDYYELLQPAAVLLKNKKILDLSRRIDDIIGRTFIKRLCIRWFIYAKKR